MTTLGERMSVSDALQSLLLEMGQQRAFDGVLREEKVSGRIS